MTELIFFENRAQVEWAKRRTGPASSMAIALTAEAAQAFDESGLLYTAACDVADLAPVHEMHKRFMPVLDALVHDADKWLAEHVDGMPKSGPGPISAEFYRLQYVVGAIITRTWLMQKAVEHFKADHIAVFRAAPDPWLERLYCEDYPWLALVPQWAQDHHLQLEWISAASPSDPWPVRVIDALLQALRSIRNAAKAILPRLKKRLTGSERSILFFGDIHYDWSDVLPNLSGLTIHRLSRFESLVPFQALTLKEKQAVIDSLQQWDAQKRVDTRISELRVDVYPALATLIQRCASVNPAIARHTEAMCVAVFKRIHPAYVCAVGMDDYASKRFAFHSRAFDTPTVCYQHGGLYGTHYAPGLDHTAPGYADFFLTYGPGIRPASDTAYPRPPQAAFVAVGSSRIDRLIKNAGAAPPPSKPLKVLWISDVSTANTIGGTFQYDDVRRYRLEKKSLAILAPNANLDITFRYFRANRRQHGIPAHLRLTRYINVHLSDTGPMDRVLAASDLVIANVHSNTSWNETIALGKPFVLFCDTRYSELQGTFLQDLKKACRFCASEDEFFSTLRAIAKDPSAWLRDNNFERTAYVKNYVLDQMDGRSAERVEALLSQDTLKREKIGGRT